MFYKRERLKCSLHTLIEHGKDCKCLGYVSSPSLSETRYFIRLMKYLNSSVSSFFGKFTGGEIGVEGGHHESFVKMRGCKMKNDRFGIYFKYTLKRFIGLSEF